LSSISNVIEQISPRVLLEQWDSFGPMLQGLTNLLFLENSAQPRFGEVD
jgi:hypothetical protein